MAQNRRKLLINSRTKSIFALFLVFSFIVAIVFLGWEIILQYIHFKNYELYEQVYAYSNLSLVLKSILLVFWVGFTFFAAYFYVETKYNGIFARIDRVFSDIASGQEKRLFFREGDAFSYVGENFNRMIANLKTSGYAQHREELSKIASRIEELLKKQDVPRQELEAILKDIKEFL